jgi:large subunit ribosomal protein L18
MKLKKSKNMKQNRRWRRHCHIRKSLIGTTERPRLNVFRSLKHIYCQIIDDTFVDKNGRCCGKTLVACSTLSPSVREQIKYGGNIEAAAIVGQMIAKLAKEKNITKVVFDRGGYKYHGRIKSLAESVRKEGLRF